MQFFSVDRVALRCRPLQVWTYRLGSEVLPRPSAASKVARHYRYACVQASVSMCRLVVACGVQLCKYPQTWGACALDGASSRLVIVHVTAA